MVKFIFKADVIDMDSWVVMMKPCNYNYNLMSMEMLKIFIIEAELDVVDEGEVLCIFNPLHINNIEVNSRALLYIIRKARTFRYTRNFFEKTEPFKMLYYFYSNILELGITFFIPKELW